MKAACLALLASLIFAHLACQVGRCEANQLNTIEIALLDDDRILVDGDLSDWEGLPMGYINAVMDRTRDTPLPGPSGQAAYWVAIDGEALYLAIRVLDDDVRLDQDWWVGDCVGWNIDVRPLEGSPGTPVLGQLNYSPGCYQLSMRPSLRPGRTAEWYCSQDDDGAPKNLEVSARVFGDGYAIEARIPFSEIDNARPERFQEPIGLNVSVNDLYGSVGTANYSLSRDVDAWHKSEGFWRTDLRSLQAERDAVVRFYAPRYYNATRSAHAAAVFEYDKFSHADDLRLDHKVESSGYDQITSSDDAKPEAAATGVPIPAMDLDGSALGLRVLSERIDVEGLGGGRHTFEANLHTGGEILRKQLRAYYREGIGKQREARMAILVEPPEDETITRLLAGSLRFTIWRNHIYEDLALLPWIGGYELPEAMWRISELAGNGDSTATHRWRLDVVKSDSSEVVVQQVTAPINVRPRPSVATRDLDKGVYLVRASIVAPDSTVHKVWFPPQWPRRNGNADTDFLVVHRQDLPVIQTQTVARDERFTHLELVGSPGREQFKGDDALSCYARSVWDLHLFEGRVYVGAGDWSSNRGPIDIWSFTPDDSAVTFQKEFKVDDHSVDRFRSGWGSLLVPGIDATESWEYGNLYIKEDEAWRKLRTIPNGKHVFDVATYEGQLFVTAGTDRGAVLYASEDSGMTWTRHSLDDVDEFHDRRYYEMAVTVEGLVVTCGHQSFAYRYRKGALERVVTPLFPGYPKRSLRIPFRLTPFAGGVLYTRKDDYGDGQTAPLYYLRDLETGAAVVDLFKEEAVRDIVAREHTCYVLTSKRVEDRFLSAVYESEDLVNWTQIAQFESGAIAQSLERAGEQFFVGMASLLRAVSTESGNIYLLRE